VNGGGSGVSKRRLQVALLATACAAALAACGGDDDGAAAPATSSTVESVDSTPLRRQLDRLVTRLLTERGLEPSVAECAVAELGETVSDEELQSAIAEIRKTGAAPPAVMEAATAAGETCGRP
jgi:hypothetical protein